MTVPLDPRVERAAAGDRAAREAAVAERLPDYGGTVVPLGQPGLIDTILDDAGEGHGSLPLLEHALLEVWERRRGRMLTLEGYRDAGGVEGALAKRAEAIVGGFSEPEEELARRTLLRLTQPGEGAEDTRRRAPLTELTSPGVEPVLDQLRERDRAVGCGRRDLVGPDPAGRVVDQHPVGEGAADVDSDPVARLRGVARLLADAHGRQP